MKGISCKKESRDLYMRRILEKEMRSLGRRVGSEKKV